MRIALLSTGFRKDAKEATGITVWELACFLRDKGNQVTIISENNEGRHAAKEDIDGITVLRFRRKGGFLRRPDDYLLSFITLVRRKRYDVIHSFSSSPVLALRGILGRIGTGAKVVHTIKSSSKHRGSMIFAWILNWCDVVTVPTKVMADSISRWGCQKKKIQIVRSPVRLKMFRPRDKDALKSRHGYSGKKIILYYGAFFRSKGVGVLARAMPDIVRSIKDVFLLLAPRYSGKEVDSVTGELDRLGMASRYEIISDSMKIEELVSMADVVVLPYLDLVGTEGNPSCLLEAAASKTPIVTTSLPELREIMEDGRDVLMARPGDPASFASLVSRVLEDELEARRLAEHAYERVDDFGSEKIGGTFLHIYGEKE